MPQQNTIQIPIKVANKARVESGSKNENDLRKVILLLKQRLMITKQQKI